MEHVQTDNRGSPGTWEILLLPRQHPGRRYRVTNSRPWRPTRPPGSEINEWHRGIAKRRKRSAARWAAGSRSTFILPMKPGNWSRGTRWREGKTARGCLMMGPGPGNTSEASNLELRINGTAQDSIPGMQRCCMANPALEEPYALMWARTGLWEPWVVTPRATWPERTKTA